MADGKSIISVVALVRGSTRRIVKIGESFPRSGSIFSHCWLGRFFRIASSIVITFLLSYQGSHGLPQFLLRLASASNHSKHVPVVNSLPKEHPVISYRLPPAKCSNPFRVLIRRMGEISCTS